MRFSYHSTTRKGLKSIQCNELRKRLSELKSTTSIAYRQAVPRFNHTVSKKMPSNICSSPTDIQFIRMTTSSRSIKIKEITELKHDNTKNNLVTHNNGQHEVFWGSASTKFGMVTRGRVAYCIKRNCQTLYTTDSPIIL